MTTTETLRSTVRDQKNYKNKVDEQHTFSDNIFVCSYALITVMPSLTNETVSSPQIQPQDHPIPMTTAAHQRRLDVLRLMDIHH
jgi:hypothetical protein